MSELSLSAERQQHVILETEKYIHKASALYQRPFELVPIRFDLTGRTIGMYKQEKRGSVIRYNPLIFAKYFDENVKDTVPHEVAHYIVAMLHPKRRVRPHGTEWKAVMKNFGANAQRTASFDVSDIPQRQYSTVLYQCTCQQHELGIRRHNNIIKRKARYLCCACGDELREV